VPRNETMTDTHANVREYIFAIGFFLALGLLLAIITFHPFDASTFAVSSEAETRNLFGPAGAAIADWSVQLFGFGAPTFALLALIEVLIAYRGIATRTTWKLRALGIPQLVLFYLALLATISPEWSFRSAQFASGGLLGAAVSEFFVTMFGRMGAVVALSFAVLATLPLCLGMRPVSVFVRLLSWSPWKNAKRLAKDLENAGDESLPSARSRSASRAHAPEVPVAEYEPEFAVAARPKTAARSSAEAGSKGANRAQDAAVEKAISPAIASGGGHASSAHLVGDTEFRELLKHLKEGPVANRQSSVEETERLKQEAKMLEEKLATFHVLGSVVHSQPGPVVNVHEFEPAPGIKVSRVLGLQDDLALGLKAKSILMAPQSGKSTIGVEIPATTREVITLRELLESNHFRNARMALPMALGKLVDGSPLVVDLASMPHLLVAGSTGSGKSVGINVMLLSLMMRHTPAQVRFILVDPKMLELSVYDEIGHLLMPVVTDPQKAAGALRWAIEEMERRYRLMKQLQVRNVQSFNQAIENNEIPEELKNSENPPQCLPYIVVVIDELCDLMMTAPKDVEDCVQRLAQKARAAGIHLILATQRPSVDVLTGVIKANLPCRLSFQVASKYDSRTIIESTGAEKLLGKGDMLFLPPGTSRLVRSHCAFATDGEIANLASHLRHLFPKNYDTGIIQQVDRASEDIKDASKSDGAEINGNEMDEDTLYDKAVEFAVETGTVSTSSIQRNFRIGYNRAARIMDRMIQDRVVSDTEVAGKPRQVVAQRIPYP
jgi:S-DNA-T family DNA segregation ATPase FtsK/SpoIIIE